MAKAGEPVEVEIDEVIIDHTTNKTTVMLTEEGHLVIRTPRALNVRLLDAPANGNAVTAATTTLKPFVYRQTQEGELTKEGVYIGRFVASNGVEKYYFAAPEDARDDNGNRLFLSFNEAAEYTQKARTLGHRDWVVPTGWQDKYGEPDILKVMFNNKSKGAFKSTFDETDSGRYLSSSLYFRGDYAKVQYFSDGDQCLAHLGSIGGNVNRFSLRLVRSLAV